MLIPITANMPTSPQYWAFATVLVCVCVPFFLLVGSLNTRRGMRFWTHKTGLAFRGILHAFTWIVTLGRSKRAGASRRTHQDEEGLDSIDSVPMSPSPQDSSAALRMKAARARNLSNLSHRQLDGEGGVKSFQAESKEVFRNHRPRLSSAGNSSNLAEMVMSEAQRKRTIAYSDEVSCANAC